MNNHFIIWIAGGVFLIAVACVFFMLALLRLFRNCAQKEEEERVGIHKTIGVSGLEHLILPEEYESEEAGIVSSEESPFPLGKLSDAEESYGADAVQDYHVDNENEASSSASSPYKPWLSRRDPWKKLGGEALSMDLGLCAGEGL
eukprot:CAMPEP_0171614656 /NCGR_PEP_ID=MMETSP0990-20121206/12440_1 /TAXON_ID=483369 /ORGANISM="non described non described, Strain CCMP2098" /LENGTH=144 /DNA_ID=CAMNT_0012178629 /DNA_START=66 /DNA_END=500 /DNA_ORIENTATION=-